MKHDDDWQPILIRDISPGQVWFKHPKKDETYGECKLGGFQWAKVTGCPEGRVAIANRMEEASVEKQYYWAPVSSLIVDIKMSVDLQWCRRFTNIPNPGVVNQRSGRLVQSFTQ